MHFFQPFNQGMFIELYNAMGTLSRCWGKKTGRVVFSGFLYSSGETTTSSKNKIMTDSDKFYEVESTWSIKHVVGDNEDNVTWSESSWKKGSDFERP